MDVSTCSLCTEPCWSYGCKPHWFSELGVLGAHPPGGSLKSWGTRYWIQTLGSLRRRWELCIPSQWHVAVLGLDFWWKCVSVFFTHFYVGIFSFIQCVEVTGSLLNFIQRALSHLLLWIQYVCRRGEFRRLLCHHLEPDNTWQCLCFYFVPNLLEWHWSTKSYRFQVHNSTTRHLHSVLSKF